MKIPKQDKIKSTFVATAGGLMPAGKSPDEGLGQLFLDVQKSGIYGDGKAFVDMVPRGRMKQIQKEYNLVKNDPNFDLREFLSLHFYKYSVYDTDFKSKPGISPREHISSLWNHLERKNRRDRGSLIALPNPYIVPGGRFDEQFYWDSYFIMLGLAVDGRWEMIEGMIKNYAYMIRKFGFIPTANRTYFLSRSQPPFFSHMVRLLAEHKGRRVLIAYLPYLVAEYNFWMKGRGRLSKAEFRAIGRVAEMPSGALLNRYYDNKRTPRPESLREDSTTAEEAKNRQADRLFLHLRAAAESGWDFSSRWFLEPHDIRTTHTADIIPVDLNSLLYQLEQTIAEAYRLLKNPISARKYEAQAERRARAINEYCWNEDEKFYIDYNFHKNTPTGRLSLAAVFPLYAGIASEEQAANVAARLEAEFLHEGGLVATPVNNGQQWDSPNGWAPLHWVAIQGLRKYGHHQLADTIKRRWIGTNLAVFESECKLVEKYDVTSGRQGGGGGEYPLQDGFGWTNGVLAALMSEDD